MEPVQLSAPPATWDMTAAVLWGVWSHTFKPFLASGRKDPVSFAWVLASPGPQGLAEIAGPQGYPTRLIAALPLVDLKAVAAGAAVLEKASSLGGLAAQPSIPVGKKALDELVALGEQVLARKDYLSVGRDLRPVTPDHPSDWLYFQRDPAATRSLRALVDEVRSEKAQA